MKFGLNDITIEKLHAVFSKFPELEQVIIYGSRAKGNFRNGSDIDMAVKGDSLTPKVLSMIWHEIDELNLPYLIDLSIFHLISSASLVEHIERVGKVLYQAEVNQRK